MQVLKGQDARAKALIEGAQRLAANAPTFLKAAQDTESRARTRYKVGLGTVVEVADAERLLTDAQVTNDLAGLSVWRAFFAASVSRGDIGPFLQLVSAAPTAPGG
jgi:outer membrane protein